jgi:phage FluMu protein Com
MFERFFEQETPGTLKGLTLEWKCPHCAGINFRILRRTERESGTYHAPCRYCRAKCRAVFPPPVGIIEGEAEFMERITEEDFSAYEQEDLIRDFAEIEYMKRDNANPKAVVEKQKLLEDKITFFKRRRHL